MDKQRIVIFGGTGFVGTVLAGRLSDLDFEVDLITRNRERAKHLWPLPNARVIEADVYNSARVAGLVTGANSVINLIGRLNEKGDNGEGFRRTHVELTKTIVEACIKANVSRYLHMSALNAEPFAPSYYLRTKGEAEKFVLESSGSKIDATVFRPSIIFGPRDSFFNRFASLLNVAVGGLPLACAHAKFQPVYVGDVAAAFITALNNKSSIGERYDLGGPEIKSLLELVRYTNQLLGKRRLIIPLGATLSSLQANIFEYLPGKPLSRDNLRSASEDSVCASDTNLSSLGIEATPIDAIVPTYIGHAGLTHYDQLRRSARRQ